MTVFNIPFIILTYCYQGVALESHALKLWLEEHNLGTVGFTGLSLGGHTAALCASISTKPVPCVAGFCWSNSAGVWTRGALSNRINWKKLNEDLKAHPGYETFRSEIGYGLTDWITKNDIENVENLPEIAQMPFPEGEENAGKNYTILLSNHFSHLGNYPTPKDTALVTFINGEMDYFYGREFMTPIDTVWPGVQVASMACGHVDGFITEGKIYRKLISKNLLRSVFLLTHILGDMFEKSSSSSLVPCDLSLFSDLPIEAEKETGTDFIQKTFSKTTINVVKLFERDT